MSWAKWSAQLPAWRDGPSQLRPSGKRSRRGADDPEVGGRQRLGNACPFGLDDQPSAEAIQMEVVDTVATKLGQDLT